MMNNHNPVEVSITLAGKKCYTNKLTLSQKFNNHHSFCATVDYEEFESVWMETAGLIFGMIGEDAQIEISHKDGTGSNQFKGIITHVEFSGKNGEKNFIIFHGSSPTIRLDGVKTMDSFMDKSLKGIVEESVQNSGNGGEVTSNPKFGGTIEYMAQYEESAFEFLNRLSWLYGEWFFYDGTQCHFGKPNVGGGETVTYDTEMDEMHFTAGLVPTNIARYHYFHHQDRPDQEKAESFLSKVAGYHTVAVERSESIYTSQTIIPAGSVVNTKQELQKIVEAEKGRHVAQMLQLKGTTRTSKIKIGTNVTFKHPATMRTTLKTIGTFLIIEVTHHYEQAGSYYNTFTGIPAEMENIPMKAIIPPKAFPQLARVKDNKNDKGLVKVELQWQKDKGKTTNWIKVQTPDGGESGKVAKNRGYMAIPEEGDMVMVEFEYGDPSRPYISGSVFTEKNGGGGGEGNKTKSITTRSGSTVTLDDSEGNILIADQTGNNTIIVDGTDKISINTTKTIEMDNGQSSIILEEDNITINSNNIIINGENFVAVLSGDQKMVTSNEDSTALLTGTSAVVDGETETVVNAPQVAISGMANVDITGGMVKINS